MDTATAIQFKIEAAEQYAAIDYGIRSIDVCRGPYGASACHVEQIETAICYGEVLIGEWIGKDNATRSKLVRAKKLALAVKREADAAVKAIGNVRQLRLALTEGAGELALAA